MHTSVIPLINYQALRSKKISSSILRVVMANQSTRTDTVEKKIFVVVGIYALTMEVPSKLSKIGNHPCKMLIESLFLDMQTSSIFFKILHVDFEGRCVSCSFCVEECVLHTKAIIRDDRVL